MMVHVIQPYGFIYKIQNLINKKIWIGQSIDPYRRWDDHKHYSEKLKKHPLYASMRKYGIGNFKFDIIDFAISQVKLDNKEIEYIKFYDCLFKNGNGYNIEMGGKTAIVTEDVRKKISERTKNAMSDENVRRHISVKLKLKWKDPIYRNKQLLQLKKRALNKQYIADFSTRIKKMWMDPEFREKQLSRLKKQGKDPSYKQKQREIKLNAYKDNEYKKNVSLKTKEAMTKEVRKKISESSKKMWSNETKRKKLIKNAKKRFATEESRIKAREIAIKHALYDEKNPMYINIPKGQLLEKIHELKRIKAVAEFFNTNRITIHNKIKKYFSLTFKQVKNLKFKK